jgi:glycosyltransferase involved in cell wall biosynthesis
MKARVLKKGVNPATVEIVPPWSHDDAIRWDVEGRGEFRRTQGLEGKFVVMYSGNHSPCHPLETLVEAASRLNDRAHITFCFVGGGSEHSKVRKMAAAHGLRNVVCLPYQPLEKLSASLSGADLHTVVMGDPFVGIVHPCKIYNILRLGTPVLYIGPPQGHIPDMIPAEARTDWFYAAQHGQVDAIVEYILSAASRLAHDLPEPKRVAERFQAQTLLKQIVHCIEFKDGLPSPAQEASFSVSPEQSAL